jgi:5-methylcytosine-specific restriction protein A
MIYRDNFTCQDCGEFHAMVNQFGMTIPIVDGDLQVHHILPVASGGGDEPSNLVTLCRNCHKKRHDKIRGSDSDENL